ncbi:MAG: hydroxyacid dehydrogenase [Saprospiraceae bacterium]|nr:hydroxyacid dehydrogenase [Saprospiraceae bacterium]
MHPLLNDRRVLITDKVHPLLIEGLKESGYDVLYDTSVENAQLKDIVQLFTGIVINSKIRMDKSMIDLGVKLKFIGRLGSGLEIIDVAYAKRKKIKVLNSPEGNRNAVAEHEMGMLLALMNNLLQADRQVRDKVWERELNRGTELKGKTLGIIGLGHTGSTLALKLSSWGLKVLSYDKYRERYPASLRFVEKCGLKELCEKSDIISLHLPLTEETTHLINADFLDNCKDGVIISNTSRGAVMDTVALISALESGKVSAACLDVFENEKPETFSKEENMLYQKLYKMDQVILSPHIAGWTKESLEGIAAVLLDKIRKSFS